jgi:hypothetical protein
MRNIPEEQRPHLQRGWSRKYDAIMIMEGRSTIFEQPVPFPNILHFQYAITIILSQQTVNFDGRDTFHP